MSIATRLWLVFAASAAAIVTLGILLLGSLNDARHARLAEEHSFAVLSETGRLLSALKDVETGQRGFLLTEDPAYLEPYTAALGSVAGHQAALRDLIGGTPSQDAWLDHLDSLIARRIDIARSNIERVQSGGRLDKTGLDDGKEAMDGVRVILTQMGNAERSGLAQAQATAAHQAQRTVLVMLVGGSVVILILLALTVRTAQAIGRPLHLLLDGTRRIAAGDLTTAVPLDGRGEFGTLARSFNGMAQSLLTHNEERESAETAQRQANAVLKAQADELDARTRSIELLGRMAHRLQSCATEAEFAEVVRRFAPQILPGAPGALYLLNNSKNLMRTVASWDEPASLSPEFTPDACWALRRGATHAVTHPDREVICPHVEPGSVGGYVCAPLMAQGELLGLLYFETAATAGDAAPGERRIDVMVENVSLALGNHRLREALRHQSIRDPLTGLFNRRYLEESLELEFARAQRGRTPIGVIMIDVDHFKRFNDQHGHDAGDAVLRAVGQALAARIRKGDVACRYGGEEFTVILPGSGPEQSRQRAEDLRAAVQAMAVAHGGMPLGSVTCSLGVACFPDHGASPDEVIEAADAALYQAKTEGRNRVVMARAPRQVAAVTRASA